MTHCPCGGEIESTRGGLGFAYVCTKCGTFSNEKSRGRVRVEAEKNFEMLAMKLKEKKR